MKHAIKSFSGAPSASARVVDGKLILSLLHALTPVVWQMDLTQASASALEVQEKGDGTAVLTLKTPRGETTDIAPFETRAQAVSALMAISKALESAQGKIRAGDSNSAEAPSSRGGRWIAVILGLIMLFILFSMWRTNAPNSGTQGASLNPAASGGTSSDVEAGVPVNADALIGR